MSKRGKKRIVDVKYRLPGGVGEMQAASTKTFAIGIPSYGQMNHEFVGSLASLVASAAGLLLRGCQITRAMLPDARNVVVEWFLDQTDARWLLQIDDDMKFSVRDVERLLESADEHARPIISGLIYTADCNIVWYARHANGLLCRYYPATAGLHRLASVGTAFLLVHRRVFERMRETAPPGEDWIWFGRDPFPPGRRPPGYALQKDSEDFTFCRRAEKLGFSIWGDSRVQPAHMKVQPIDFSFIQRQWAGEVALRKFGAQQIAQWGQDLLKEHYEKVGDGLYYEKAEAPPGSPGQRRDGGES
jgi:hypothetical protein